MNARGGGRDIALMPEDKQDGGRGIARRWSEAVEEKNDPKDRWSAKRLVIISMALSWIAVLVIPVAVHVAAVGASLFGRWEGATELAPVTGPMANLGIGLAIAVVLMSLLDRVPTNKVVDAVKAAFGALGGLASGGGGYGGGSPSSFVRGRLGGVDDSRKDDERGGP